MESTVFVCFFPYYKQIEWLISNFMAFKLTSSWRGTVGHPVNPPN